MLSRVKLCAVGMHSAILGKDLKRQGVFLLPSWMGCMHHTVIPSSKFAVPIYSPGHVERQMRVKGPARKHNTVSLARAQTQITQSRDECTNHESTATGREQFPADIFSSLTERMAILVSEE